MNEALERLLLEAKEYANKAHVGDMEYMIGVCLYHSDFDLIKNEILEIENVGYKNGIQVEFKEAEEYAINGDIENLEESINFVFYYVDEVGFSTEKKSKIYKKASKLLSIGYTNSLVNWYPKINLII
jgi:hypothetical protein